VTEPLTAEEDEYAGRCETQVAYGYPCDLVVQQASTIEAQAREIAALREGWDAKYRALEAENTQLRAALEHIRDTPGINGRDYARAALTSTEGKQ